jgi:hypothetical protein
MLKMADKLDSCRRAVEPTADRFRTLKTRNLVRFHGKLVVAEVTTIELLSQVLEYLMAVVMGRKPKRL